MESKITLYHGTSIASALDILNNGLNTNKLSAQQTRQVQLGTGWYVAFDIEIAKFFGALATGSFSSKFTVIEMTLPITKLEYLLTKGEARREIIVNVPFVAEQIWFSVTCFDFLNEQANFRPYQER